MSKSVPKPSPTTFSKSIELDDSDPTLSIQLQRQENIERRQQKRFKKEYVFRIEDATHGGFESTTREVSMATIVIYQPLPLWLASDFVFSLISPGGQVIELRGQKHSHPRSAAKIKLIPQQHQLIVLRKWILQW